MKTDNQNFKKYCYTTNTTTTATTTTIIATKSISKYIKP